MNAMEKLTKSMSLFKERNCSVSIVLDSRTRRKNAYEFPLSLRFTIDRKFFYLTVGSSFTEKKFSDICNATKCKSENYKLQKEWKDTITPKYKDILTNLNKGGILTFEMVRQCIMGEGVVLFNEDTTKAQSFVSVWEQVIHELRTDDGGVRFTTAESYECSLKSFRKILGTDVVKGFCISAAEIQKMKEGMHNGAVVCYSYSKSLSLPGERIGYVVIPDEVEDSAQVIAAAVIANRVIGCVNAPSLMQRVIKRCLNEQVNLEAYDRNRHLLYQSLTDYGFSCVKPEGAFYLFMKTPMEEKAFCELCKKHHVLVVPGSSFACPGYVRISYCVSYEQIERSLPAFRRIAEECGLEGGEKA